jgi:uncharacterized membrane protein
MSSPITQIVLSYVVAAPLAVFITVAWRTRRNASLTGVQRRERIQQSAYTVFIFEAPLVCAWLLTHP